MHVIVISYIHMFKVADITFAGLKKPHADWLKTVGIGLELLHPALMFQFEGRCLNIHMRHSACKFLAHSLNHGLLEVSGVPHWRWGRLYKVWTQSQKGIEICRSAGRGMAFDGVSKVMFIDSNIPEFKSMISNFNGYTTHTPVDVSI